MLISTTSLRRTTCWHGWILDCLDARNWKIEEGRAFGSQEVETGARVILIGQTVANVLFGAWSAIGQPVRVKNVAFTVVGLLKSEGTSTVGWDQDEVALVPLRTARTRIIGRGGTRSDQLHGIYVSVREEWQIPVVEKEIFGILHQRHHFRFATFQNSWKHGSKPVTSLAICWR